MIHLVAEFQIFSSSSSWSFQATGLLCNVANGSPITLKSQNWGRNRFAYTQQQFEASVVFSSLCLVGSTGSLNLEKEKEGVRAQDRSPLHRAGPSQALQEQPCRAFLHEHTLIHFCLLSLTTFPSLFVTVLFPL